MTESARLLLGIDLGTSSVKVVACTEEGRVVGHGGADYPIDRPGPDRAEQDPQAWWTALVAATRAALAMADGSGRRGDDGRPADALGSRTRGGDGGRAAAGRARSGGAAGAVVAIGMSGQMHGTVLLSAAHRPLGPAIIWPDRRSRSQVAEITAEVGADRLLQVVGGPLATGFQAATIRWLREEDPRRWDRTRLVLVPKDALRLRLTGEVAAEASDGSGTALLDVRSRDWSEPLLAAAGIGRDRLPTLRGAAEPAGRLRPAAAARLGLRPGTIVVTGAGDTPAGLLGAGLVDRDAFLLTISTGGQLAVPSRSVEIDPGGRSHTFCAPLDPSADAAGWYRMAAILSAGIALRWLRDAVLGVEGADAYERMLAWAAEAPTGAGGLVFLPYLAGERSPHMDPDARGVLLGLTASHGRAELVRAVVEGITLACFDASRVLAEAGALPDRLVLAGGGARSPLWQQIVADVFGLPVRRLETGEQAALGACLLAASGAGILDPVEAAPRWARLGPAVEPDPARHARYGDLLVIFRRAYQAHRDDFRSLRALADAPPGHP